MLMTSGVDGFGVMEAKVTGIVKRVDADAHFHASKNVGVLQVTCSSGDKAKEVFGMLEGLPEIGSLEWDQPVNLLHGGL